MELYDYQWEVTEPALEGKNIIIWLPTGSGKTRAALYVAMRHLEMKRNSKVAMVVNKVHLVQQHYSKEFQPRLKDKFKVIPISGDTEEKGFFAQFVRDNDVIICTAQILQNALCSNSEEKRIELSEFSLLIIDECHHTHKDGVYNKLMECYIERKLLGDKNLPQILGLTASPGTGRASNLKQAVDHILQICANLDIRKIMSANVYMEDLEERTKQPAKQYDVVNERPQDPFGDKLKELMTTIHEYLNAPDFLSRDFGTQTYEQEVVELEKTGAVESNRMKRTCALHLRKYNDALFTHDTVRMKDAFDLLDTFYQMERFIRRVEDPTDLFLYRLFEDNRARLLQLSEDERFENPKLVKLEEILKEQFQISSESRGIIFTKTRQSTYCLHDWIVNKPSLKEREIKSAALTGAGYSNQSKHMTQNEQLQVIERFRNGHLNLLISTSVAEEGLDIPQCNTVVRYGLMTNEISMVQARGRARAENSCYSYLAKSGSREVRREKINESLEDLMKRAIKNVQEMPEREYEGKIKELQKESLIERKVKQVKKEDLKNMFPPENVMLSCRGCGVGVGYGSHLRLLEYAHRVNVNPDFKIYYTVSSEPVVLGKKMEEWVPGKQISCHCGQSWGMEMIYKSLTLPMISIKNFVVQTPESKKPYKRWKDVPFHVEEFDFQNYCLETMPDLFDD
ncbi:ATP-dependent RNA helicase DHX58 [Discoglossus pictus]